MRVEARIQVPQPGQGLWAAFWLSPLNFSYGGWPLSGEVRTLDSLHASELPCLVCLACFLPFRVLRCSPAVHAFFAWHVCLSVQHSFMMPVFAPACPRSMSWRQSTRWAILPRACTTAANVRALSALLCVLDCSHCHTVSTLCQLLKCGSALVAVAMFAALLACLLSVHGTSKVPLPLLKLLQTQLMWWMPPPASSPT